MERPPRPKSESIINKPMSLGIVVQTFAQTGAVLSAFLGGALVYAPLVLPLPPLPATALALAVGSLAALPLILPEIKMLIKL